MSDVAVTIEDSTVEITVDEEVSNIVVNFRECGGAVQGFATDPTDESILLWLNTSANELRYRDVAGVIHAIGSGDVQIPLFSSLDELPCEQ